MVAKGSLTDFDTLKSAGTVLGIISASGGILAALSFGIGYLAITERDAVVGLPTTVVDYSTYVRTGALFFSTSLFHLFSASVPYILVGVAVTFIHLKSPIVRRS